MKPETEIRNLKRELREALEHNRRLTRERNSSDNVVSGLMAEVKEWKARFDTLLDKLGKVE